jgi:sulfite exporter TauE/SafE
MPCSTMRTGARSAADLPMTDLTGAVTLSAAALAGAAGSAHCVVMCGGLAGALGMRARAVDPSAARRDVSLYHCGRLAGYATAGALFGLLGASFQALVDLPLLASVARIAAGVLIILAAIKVLLPWNPLAPIERMGARYWKKLQPLAGRAINSRSVARGLVLGLLWGWLPCGLVYSMLVFAALSGDALRGAGIMLAFGLGTLPAMLASSAIASRLGGWLGQRPTRQLSGVVLLLFGVWLTWAAVPSPAHHHHPLHTQAASVGSSP